MQSASTARANVTSGRAIVVHAAADRVTHATCVVGTAVTGTLAKIVQRRNISCAAARVVVSAASRSGEPSGWTCQGDLTVVKVLTCGSANASFAVRPLTVVLFGTADRRILCADEPTDDAPTKPGLECVAAKPVAGCDGEVIIVAGIGVHGLPRPLSRGCSGGLPLDIGSAPAFTPLTPGRAVAHAGFTCSLVSSHTVRCSNLDHHGFEIGPNVARTF